MTVWGAAPDQSHSGPALSRQAGTGPFRTCSDHAEKWGLCSPATPCFQILGSWAWNPIPTMPQVEEMSLDHARMFLPREHGHPSQGMFQPGTLAFFSPALCLCSAKAMPKASSRAPAIRAVYLPIPPPILSRWSALWPPTPVPSWLLVGSQTL